MFHHLRIRGIVAVSAAACLPVAAQTAAAPGAPVATPASTLTYRSVLEGYQSFSDEKVISWKEANETVEKVGGWRAYAKEAREGDSAGEGHAGHGSQGSQGSQAPAPAPKSANPHAGHGKQ